MENEPPARCTLGVDIGGTGIKAALVNLDTGELVGERVRMATPRPATIPKLTRAVVNLTAPLVDHADSSGAIGVAFPAVVRRGIALSAVNVAPEWLYADVGKVFAEAFQRETWALNDSDAAAFAEARFGAGRDQGGAVVTITLGTGVGTGLVVDGVLVPNVELGCLTVRGKPAGARVANSVRKARKLSWRRWAADLQRYIDALDEAVAPDMVIIGGGVSARSHEYLPYIRTRPLVVPARLRNDAGVIGAAAYAALLSGQARVARGQVDQLLDTQTDLESKTEPEPEPELPAVSSLAS